MAQEADLLKALPSRQSPVRLAPMFDLSKWLDSCFDQSDDRAPLRAFVFGAVMTPVVAVVCSLGVDPADGRLLSALLAGAVILGGGCSAMFALPPDQFTDTWKFALRFWPFAPFKLLGLGGVGLIPLFFMSFVDILLIAVVLTAIRVVVMLCMNWRYRTRQAS